MARTQGWRAALALESAHWDHFVSSHPEALLAAIRALPGEAFIEIPSLLVGVNYLQHVISGDDPLRFHDIALAEGGRADEEKHPLDIMISSAGRTAGHRTGGRLAEAVSSARQGRRIFDEMTPPSAPSGRWSCHTYSFNGVVPSRSPMMAACSSTKRRGSSPP